MRSAIFDDTRSRGRSSPTPNSFRKRTANNATEKSILTWNLDDMVAAYQENKSLPPMLSPTLPPMVALTPSLPPVLTPSTSNLSLSEGRTTKVKYIDKTAGTKRRFIIRFTFKDSSTLKNAFRPSTPVPRASKTVSKPATPISKAASKMSPKKEIALNKLPNNDDLIKLKTYWTKLAKECKFMCNSTEGIVSLIIEFDSLLLFSLAYYFDDKQKLNMGVPLLDMLWRSLLEDIDKCISRSAKFNKPKAYLAAFIELLRTFKIYVNKHIIEIYGMSRPVDSLIKYQEIEELQILIETNIPNLNLFIREKFPDTWANKINNMKSLSPELLPLTGNYYLPIGPHLNLHQYLRVFFHFVNEFIDIYNKDNDLIYSLKSGLKGP